MDVQKNASLQLRLVNCATSNTLPLELSQRLKTCCVVFY